MASGVKSTPSFIAPLAADPNRGVFSPPDFLAPQAKDTKAGVVTVPTFIAPLARDDVSAADSPTPVEPQDLAGSADGAEEIGSVSLHEAVFLTRSDTGFTAPSPQQATQGPRVNANVFHSNPSQGHSDTDGYAITIVNPDNVKARSAIVEGNVTPRARMRGMGGGPY